MIICEIFVKPLLFTADMEPQRGDECACGWWAVNSNLKPAQYPHYALPSRSSYTARSARITGIANKSSVSGIMNHIASAPAAAGRT